MSIAKVKMKAEHSLLLVELVAQQTQSEATIWYNIQGLLNAYYSITEEIIRKIGNTKDKALKEAVNEWMKKRKKSDNLFGDARNKVTHRGLITIEREIFFILDEVNDTEYPSIKYTITIEESDDRFHKFNMDEFILICRKEFDSLYKSITELEDDFIRRGGFLNKPLNVDKQFFGTVWQQSVK